MARVYRLKHATNRMKYQHMQDVLEWRANLNDVITNPPDRHVALETIQTVMGMDFEDWYQGVYSLRKANKHTEYEQAIFAKLAELTQSKSVQENL